MTIISAILIFILGTAIGSFLSMLLHRIKTKEKGIIFSRSFCPKCKKKIKWRHLLPVFSWLWLRGKCAYCNEKISPHYLFIELVTGMVFIAFFFKFNFIDTIYSSFSKEIFTYRIDWLNLELFTYNAFIFVFLIAIFFYDLCYKEIPDRLSLPALGLALGAAFIFTKPGIESALIGSIGIFAFFLFQYLISGGKWIGGGDLRLGAITGMYLGWEKGLLAIIMAYIIGSMIGIALLASKKANRKTAIPFGPFIITGIIIAVFFGDFLIQVYLGGISFNF